ncbi:MAG: chemotaxis protein CheW [Methylophilaceae bacterium]
MARENKLRDYQSSILARLESVKNADAEAPAGYLGVQIGDKNVLVDLQEITETLPVSEIHPVPLVKPWFLGVSNVRGVLYAINDLAQILDNKFTKVSSNTRLLLMSDSVAANVAFLADKLIGLRNLNTLTKRDVELQENICLKAETYEDAEKRIWHILDSVKLAQSKEFTVPYVG